MWKGGGGMQVDESKLSKTERLALASCRLNRWEWDEYIGPKPEGFDEMPCYDPKPNGKREIFPTKADYIAPAVTAIEKIIGEAEVSKFYWIHELGRDEEAWMKWYITERFMPYEVIGGEVVKPARPEEMRSTEEERKKKAEPRSNAGKKRFSSVRYILRFLFFFAVGVLAAELLKSVFFG